MRYTKIQCRECNSIVYNVESATQLFIAIIFIIFVLVASVERLAIQISHSDLLKFNMS